MTLVCIAAATVGLFAAQAVYAAPAPVYSLSGLFDSEQTGGSVGKARDSDLLYLEC